jgi:hypothetical protein
VRRITIKDGKLVDLGTVVPRKTGRGRKTFRRLPLAQRIHKLDFQCACLRAGLGDKYELMELLRDDYALSSDDKLYLAELIEAKPKGKKRGRRTDRNIREVVYLMKTLIRPVLKKSLVEKKRQLRKAGLPHGIEDKIIESAIEYMRFEGMLVDDDTYGKLQNLYHRKR